MKQTEQYKLNQWELSDRIQMADFNADNLKLEAALAGLAGASKLEIRKGWPNISEFPNTSVVYGNVDWSTICLAMVTMECYITKECDGELNLNNSVTVDQIHLTPRPDGKPTYFTFILMPLYCGDRNFCVISPDFQTPGVRRADLTFKELEIFYLQASEDVFGVGSKGTSYFLK